MCVGKWKCHMMMNRTKSSCATRWKGSESKSFDPLFSIYPTRSTTLLTLKMLFLSWNLLTYQTQTELLLNAFNIISISRREPVQRGREPAGQLFGSAGHQPLPLPLVSSFGLCGKSKFYLRKCQKKWRKTSVRELRIIRSPREQYKEQH